MALSVPVFGEVDTDGCSTMDEDLPVLEITEDGDPPWEKLDADCFRSYDGYGAKKASVCHGTLPNIEQHSDISYPVGEDRTASSSRNHNSQAGNPNNGVTTDTVRQVAHRSKGGDKSFSRENESAKDEDTSFSRENESSKGEDQSCSRENESAKGEEKSCSRENESGNSAYVKTRNSGAFGEKLPKSILLETKTDFVPEHKPRNHLTFSGKPENCTSLETQTDFVPEHKPRNHLTFSGKPENCTSLETQTDFVPEHKPRNHLTFSGKPENCTSRESELNNRNLVDGKSQNGVFEENKLASGILDFNEPRSDSLENDKTTNDSIHRNQVQITQKPSTNTSALSDGKQRHEILVKSNVKPGILRKERRHGGSALFDEKNVSETALDGTCESHSLRRDTSSEDSVLDSTTGLDPSKHEGGTSPGGTCFTIDSCSSVERKRV